MTKNYEIGLAIIVFTYLLFYVPMIYAVFKIRKDKKDKVKDLEN